MKQRKIQKFIDNFDKNIKYIREEYYNKISLNQYNETLLFLEKILTIIIYLSITIYVFISNFTFISIITSIFIVIIYEIIQEYVLSKLNNKEKNQYLKEIKKQKFKTIEDYEKSIKEYITGPNGYYEKLLDSIKNEHHINDETKTIKTIEGESFYIWSNKKNNMFFLLNTGTNSKPEIKRIKIQNIKYYRNDKQNKYIVLNTTEKLLFLTLESIDVLDNLLPNKKYESYNTFSPEEYIKDFELYMHKQIKKVHDNQKNEANKIINKNVINIISIISIIIINIIRNTNNLKIFNIISLIILYVFIYNNNSILKNISNKRIDKNKILQKIVENEETKERFNELKKMLNIKETHESIYTTLGEKIIVWKNNNYLHLFYNEINENIKYIVVKAKDINYQQNEQKYGVIKIKNKEIYLRKDAIDTIMKYL